MPGISSCERRSRFRFFGLHCSFLCTCCWCVGFTSLNCLCGKAEEDISSPSSVPVSLICLTWFSPETVASSFPTSCFRLFTFHFFERSLVFSPSVSSPLHLCASIPPLSDAPSFYLSLSLFSSSSVFPPPPLLPQRHLSSISVFSPPSMCLQPFSHPTSNQTYSACWWSSNGPQVDFYLSMHEAPSLHILLLTPPLPTHQPFVFSENSFIWVLDTWHWHYYGIINRTLDTMFTDLPLTKLTCSQKKLLHIGLLMSVPVF